MTVEPSVSRRPAFFLGVTGKMDLPGYRDEVCKKESLKPAVREVYSRIWAVLDWLRGKEGLLDPGQGRFCPGRIPGEPAETPWKPLGLEKTPIVILSALAPGGDTLAAEAALDYADKYPGCSVSVRAPLPFPLPQYEKASTFLRNGDPRGNAARLARFRALLERIREQPGFVEDRDLFCVRLDPHLEGDPAADLNARTPQGKPRRYLRYRASGEYIATHSHLLLAIYDEIQEKPGDPFDLFSSGAVDIVEAKRKGLSYKLLSLSNSFAWADNGPVLRIPIDNGSSGEQPCRRPLALLHPYDTRPVFPTAPDSAIRRLGEALFFLRPSEKRPISEPEDLPDDDPAWQLRGDGIFRGVCARQEEFNRLGADPARENSELRGMLGIPKSAPVPWIAEACADLAAVRRRAADSSSKKEAQREKILKRLALLIFASATLLGAFQRSTVPFPGAEPGSSPWLLQSVGSAVEAALLVTALLCLAFLGWSYWRHRCRGAESQRFDHRAIGEALRVQFYWNLCGVHASASAEYMQRQRSELSWIRYVVGAMAFPIERWPARFQRLGHAGRLEILKITRSAWVLEQRNYARKTAIKNAGRLHVWQHRGWSLAAAGLLNVIGLAASELSPHLGALAAAHCDRVSLFGAALGLLALAGHLVRLRLHGGAPHDELYEDLPCSPGETLFRRTLQFGRWILARPLAWGWALLVAGLAFRLACFFPASSSTLLPTSSTVWVVLTGMLFLAGALCLAWSERNFHAEHARKNMALEQLYASANRRLEELIARYDREGRVDSATLEEIQAMLRALGREALEENAEWLILHRTRPLEPFLA